MQEFRDYFLLAGFSVQTIMLGVTLFKFVWGSGAGLQAQFASITASSMAQVAQVRDEWQGKFDAHTANFGNVVANLNERIHAIELAAANMRADAAETYMRRDSYYKAADEFKRDVKEVHDDIKNEMNEGFLKLENQVAELTRLVVGTSPPPNHGRRGG